MVFKALDTRLNRSVAIKALPPACLADSERKRRFLHEAKAASALNHPNIVIIYGIAEEQGTDFLVMEYVSGKTLDQLNPHKALPLKRALKYSLEIADGLSAAHAVGIVHRDIKPSNIMVTAQDRVKILDFGLAKLTEESGAEAVRNSLETLPGKVIGTAAYMSPEQAEGKPADARSDIFSFGVLLYEMVTGSRPFQGDTSMRIISAVIGTDPPPVRSIAPDVPLEIEKIVSRCLRKDPVRRIQHMGDVRLALEEALLEINAAPAEPAARPRRRVGLVFAIVTLIIGVALGVFLASRILLPKTPVTFRRLTFRQGDVETARFAPGGTVVYGGAWDGAPSTLFSAQPGVREARDLGLPPAKILSISRSGEMLILLAHNTLAQVPLGGGVPRELLENVSAADWDPAGKAIAVVRTVGGRHRVEYPIGTVLYETAQVRPPLQARVSPRGDLVAFFDFTEVGDYSLTLVGPRRPRQVLSAGWRAFAGVGWSPDGKELWLAGLHTGSDPALYAVDLSGRERMLAQMAGWPSLCDIAEDGRLLLSLVDSRIGLRSLAPGAKEERELGWLDASSVSALSSDGKTLVFSELASGEGRNPAIYLRRTDGSPAVKLGYGNGPRLSPDGKFVICIRREENATQLLVLPTGPGEARTLPDNGIRPQAVDWFPDGQRILITGNESNQPPRTYIADLDTGKTRPVTAPGVRASQVSPDGRAAVVLTPTGKVYLHVFDTGAETAIGAADPDTSVVRWSSDGRHLFLGKRGGRREVILRLDTATGRTEVERELKTPDPLSSFLQSFVLSADGKAYAFSYQRDLATLYLVKGVR
jgi:Tol biopolymer transport system component